MSLPRFFIDRPIFATVLSVLIVLIGTLSYLTLPVAQYPEIALPTVVVRAAYPGATPETLAETVATPLEQEINGVEGMLYMQSQSTADGSMQLTVTFGLGTDLDQAQVLVQNRVGIALPRLPEEVRQVGVTTLKASPDLMMVVHLVSPDGSRDQLYISNYAYLRVRDRMARLEGVGDVQVYGGSDYSMRVWLDIERIQSLDLTAADVVAALRTENVQVAAGTVGREPLEREVAFELAVASQGRLRTPAEFGDVVVKAGSDGRLVRLADVARIELAARDYSLRSYLDGSNAVALALFQRPDSNALETADGVVALMDELRADFPAGLDYEIVYDPTQYVAESIAEVLETLLVAGALVVLTVFVFLQGWRPTLIPVVAIPISLIGTFAAMQALGFSLNTLSLFGLVLAIGIVVDDAIVVVENVERLLEQGLSPLEATRRAMDEVGSALIATSLVLIAVFVPTSFLGGISGQFFRQFALTIAVSTAISTFVSLTLSPALAALLLRPKAAVRHGVASRVRRVLVGWFFWLFDRVFEGGAAAYTWLVRHLLRLRAPVLVAFVGLVVLTGWYFGRVPTGFIPAQDQGYLIVSLQLPGGASLDRTDAVTQRVSELALETPGVEHAVAFVGLSGATRALASNAAAVFVTLADAAERSERGQDVDALLADLRGRLAAVPEAMVFVLSPPPVPGIGTGGGFKLMVQDRSGLGLPALVGSTWSLVGAAAREPDLAQVFSTATLDTPRLFADIDRTRARMLDVPLESVFGTLQTYLGSSYVNDFNFLGRTYRVTAQADGPFRDEAADIAQYRARNAHGELVPLGSLVEVRETSSTDRLVRYNLFPAAEVLGETRAGVSTGQALDTVERLARERLPSGLGYEWTDLAYQERNAGGAGVYLFPLCVLFVFLTLAAQYESWLLPLAVILIVPMCILCALVGVDLRGMDNNVLTQIGLVTLVGLACKNAILLVEFAAARERAGADRFQAALEACRLRLRPILMTALSFVLGVVPLVTATGAGAEMRRALGTAVFSGMLGVTFFGLLLTPVFYVALRRFARRAPPLTT